jgi:hypothetical protein
MRQLLFQQRSRAAAVILIAALTAVAELSAIVTGAGRAAADQTPVFTSAPTATIQTEDNGGYVITASCDPVLFGGLDREALAAIGIDLDAVRVSVGSSAGPEALAQVARREPRPSGLKGGPSALVLLQRAHPDIFEDALQAVISKAKEQKS